MGRGEPTSVEEKEESGAFSTWERIRWREEDKKENITVLWIFHTFPQLREVDLPNIFLVS